MVVISTTLTSKHEVTDPFPQGGELNDKKEGYIRVSGFNRGGITCENIEDTLWYTKEMGIDVQCFSETNLDTNITKV